MKGDGLATKETIHITEKGTAYSQLEGERHSNADYVVVSDVMGEDGQRTVVFAPHPEDTSQKREEIVKAILKSLGESRSKSMRKLLNDVFADYFPEAINRIYEKVVLGKLPVKAKEGCFKLIVGDGRSKEHEEIMLRD